MNQQQPTIKEIAKRLNISISTVSRALHDHASIGLRTKMRVKQLAKDLNYEPNQAAIYFQKGKTFTLGVILPALSEAFFSTAISGIEDTAYKSKYTILLGQSHDDEEREKQIVETMKNHRVDGLIVSISKNTTDYTHFEALKKYNIPVIFFDRIPNLTDVNYVSCNIQSGTIQAVNFLLNKGFRVIGMINGPDKLVASQQRLEGYLTALKKHRLKYDPTLIISCDLTKEGTNEAMRQLITMRRKPTAIVAFNDYVALDAIKYARNLKMKINEDITFVSYANLPISHYTEFPPLASVEQYPYEQGQKVTETLIKLLGEKNKPNTNIYHKIVLDSHLIIYSSDRRYTPTIV